MVRDAESHAEEDRRRREEADVRNRADTLVYQTEKILREQGDKVSDEEKGAVESSLAELKDALNGGDVDRMNAASDNLMAASQKMSQLLYEQAAREESGDAAGAASGDQGAPANDDEVVDAEIVEDDKDQKDEQ
jgi:molecular chaperone DnaK